MHIEYACMHILVCQLHISIHLLCEQLVKHLRGKWEHACNKRLVFPLLYLFYF